MTDVPVDENGRKIRRMESYAAYLDRTGQRAPTLAEILTDARTDGRPSTPDGGHVRPDRAVTSTDHAT